MSHKKILLAVDFAADNEQIIAKAKDTAEGNQAQLLLTHVNQPLATAYNAAPMGGWSPQIAEIEAELRQHAEAQLNSLGDELGVAENNRFLREGRPSNEIKALAEAEGVDLIVMGTHGQHGLGLLLGSTANAVLHGVACDVLAVRVKD